MDVAADVASERLACAPLRTDPDRMVHHQESGSATWIVHRQPPSVKKYESGGS